MGEPAEQRLWWIVAAIAALGLALRVAAAQGGLWLDEAWSALMADQARTPVGVFLHINHDNNHHLNSLWLQLVGLDAPPWLQRALSIATGTATILIAALIGARRSPATAIVAALLFALSPILVTYGSEARGYAPMLLALMTGVWLVDRWLEAPDGPAPAIPLALVALLGLLSQLTMAFGLAALGLSAAWSLRGRGARGAALALTRAFAPAAIVALAVVAGIWAAARPAGGLHFGAMEPFTLAGWTSGLGQNVEYSFGHLLAPLAALLVLFLRGFRLRRDRLNGFALVAAILVPATILALRLPNPGGARYYLLTSVAALLFAAGAIAVADRLRAALALALLLVPMAALSLQTIADQRADPARALAAIAARAPTGTDAAVERPRSEAILIAAATSARYPLALRQSCPAARFLFVERDGAEPFPATATHCGTVYREIAGDTVDALSGTQWKLYERSAR
jgi:hypothetical protein